MTPVQRRRLASARMKAQWQDPVFRAAASSAASRTMKAKWSNPSFVDKQMRAAVRNWSRPDYRQRQGRAIQAGRRPLPLANQPPGDPCTSSKDGTACSRRGPHAFHVAVVGRLDDASLTMTGWAS